VRTDDGAELAIAVVDECHGLGLGSRLLDLLLDLAAAAGVTTLEATTAASNSKVLSMLHRRGFRPRPSSGPHLELVRG
jgi:acetyltransferase